MAAPQMMINSKKQPFSERFFLALVLVLVFAMAARTPLDSDMWWHLRAGEQTLQDSRPVTIDTFSFTRYGEPWVNHSWLSQVVMYLAFRYVGYLGLGFLVALLAAASMAWVYLQMDGHPLLRGFTLIFASLVAAKVWSPRPQLFSLFLFGLLGYILYLYKWRRRDRLWWLPLLFVFWSNLHGGYVLGLMLVAAMVAGEIINHLLGVQSPEVISWRGLRRLVLIGLLSGLVVVINPNGLAVWSIPFRTLNVGALQDFISEWASPDFHDLTQQPFLWLLLGTFAAVGLSKRGLDATDLVGVIGFAYLALVARRNFGPFAMVAAPVLSRHLHMLWLEQYGRLREMWSGIQGQWRLPDWIKGERQFTPTAVKILNSLILGTLVMAAGVKLWVVTNPGLVNRYETLSFPKAAVAWIQENSSPRNIFNEYDWGGYLIWKLPAYRVFVDGRTDLYNDPILSEYLQIIVGKGRGLDLSGGYSVSLVLVRSDSTLNRVIQTDTNWKQAYTDPLATVWLRK